MKKLFVLILSVASAIAQLAPLRPPAVFAKAAATLDLLWTGIDLRLTREGQYVFLEANPSPMFLGFQHRCGLPLMESLAELIMGG